MYLVNIMYMQNVGEHLERGYKLFIDEEKPLPFFQGLADYLDYAFSVTELKHVFATHLGERNAQFEKLYKLREKTEKETQAVAEKLLEVVKDLGLDPSTFDSHGAFIMPPFTNVVEELIAFQAGQIRSEHFWTDNVERYLFAIAVNLIQRGHKDKVKELIVSRKDYYDYHLRAYAQPDIFIPEESDTRKYFIFSKTLPDYKQQQRLIDKERLMKPWGRFEKLYQFGQAFKNSATARDPMAHFLDRNIGEFGNPQADSTEITFLQSEIDNLVKQHIRWPPQNYSREQPRHLVQENFRAAAKAAHSHLMRIASQSTETQETYINKKGYDFSFEGSHLPLSEGTDYYCVLDALYTLIPEGGKTSYAALGSEVKKRVPRTKSMSAAELRSFILRNLTDEANGFLRYAKLPNSVAGGKKLIRAMRGKGIEFNNKKSG